MIKRRHHYVWQEYLRAFCHEENMLYCLLDSKIKSINTVNVAIEKDIYRLKGFGKNEIFFLKQIFIERRSPAIGQLTKNWISAFSLFAEVINQSEQDFFSDEDVKTEIKKLEHNLSEDIHADIESKGIKYISKMRAKDLSFWHHSELWCEFMFFILNQYFRTKKMKDAFSNVNVEGLCDMSKIANILPFIFATTAGDGLYKSRAEWELVGLENNTDTPFVTSDQPIINLYSNYLQDYSEELSDDQLELYYPIQPDYAVVIKLKKSLFLNYDVIDFNLVDYLNRKIILASHQQVYSNKYEVLSQYKPQNPTKRSI